jgi:ribosomal-protein-alanine N-acetyltransferase
MSSPPLPFVVRPMQPLHLPSVMAIEHTAFALPWPESAYRHEITRNELAHYYVLCFDGPVTLHAGADDVGLWQRLVRTFRAPADPTGEIVLGYGGFWMMVDEAHISTLAVRQDVRGRGMGELLLMALLEEARRLGAAVATLEVRVSNIVAQSLYRKYGFEVVGQRKAYYQDNGEDALIMTTPQFRLADYWQLVSDHRAALMKRLSAYHGTL